MKRVLFFLASSFQLLASSFLFPSPCFANNISITNVTLASQDTTADTVTIQFDISWSNSWRDDVNYDAAWIFIKYSTDIGVTWNHAVLKTSGTNPSGFSQGSSGTPIDIVVPNDRKGCFIQRSMAGAGSGTLSTTVVKVVWDYANASLTDAQAGSTDTQIKIFGVEMTYIPEGSFYIGDGGNGAEGQFQWSPSTPGSIQSEDHVVDFENAGSITNAFVYDTDTGGTDDDASANVFTVGSSFPKGYAAFYLMKYELSQGQYRDFLNTLTRTQQNTRTASQTASQYAMTAAATVTQRDFIRNPASIPAGAITFGCDYALNLAAGDGTFNASGDGEWVAADYISWMDLCAYGDWAALRPMSEFEFEKACRGPIYPVLLEYAWGSTTLNQAVGAPPTNTGQTSEVPTNTGTGLANYNGAGADIPGPMRVGAAATSTTNRQQSGAGYYGNLDLTGNVWEHCVTIGNAAGRGFAGTHGDGVLTSTGSATNPDWPGFNTGTPTNGVDGAGGSGTRGGAWDVSTTAQLSASNRHFAGTTNSSRYADFGGRLARSANS